jgi:hypothetical protein
VERKDFQECHGTADVILELLGGQAEGRSTGWIAFKNRLARDRRGVYRVDIRVPVREGLPRWDHTFAVLKIGTDVVIYQSFQGAYSLARWLDGTAGAHTHFAAPSGQGLAPDRVTEFFSGIEAMLARFVDGKEPSGFFSCFKATPDYADHADKFYDSAVNLFGAPASRRGMHAKTIADAIKAGSVEVRWTRAPVE